MGAKIALTILIIYLYRGHMVQNLGHYMRAHSSTFTEEELFGGIDLKNPGDTLILLDPSETVLHQITYPEISRDNTYA